jgi:hypothetical protein
MPELAEVAQVIDSCYLNALTAYFQAFSEHTKP